jgi:hypothetical protein
LLFAQDAKLVEDSVDPLQEDHFEQAQEGRGQRDRAPAGIVKLLPLALVDWARDADVG